MKRHPEGKREMGHTRPIRRMLKSVWIPEKEELEAMILPHDIRRPYVQTSPYPYAEEKLKEEKLKEKKQKRIDYIFGLLQSDILRVLQQEMPAKLPKHLSRDILRTWVGRNNLPGFQDDLIDRLDRPSKEWCHHDPEMGYLVAKLFFVRFRSKLLQEWRVVGKPYYGGGKADVGLINPKGECIIAVEIGNIKCTKFKGGFSNHKLSQLWHIPYDYYPKDRRLRLFNVGQYKWQRQAVYFIWTRGLRWGEGTRRKGGS